MADERERRPKVEVEQAEQGKKAPGAATGGAAPGADAAPKPDADSGPTLRGAGSRVRSWVGATFPGNENAFWGGVVGLVAALVLIAIGPWYTLVIAVLVLAGVAVGQLADGDPKIINALRRLFSRGNQ